MLVEPEEQEVNLMQEDSHDIVLSQQEQRIIIILTL